MSNNTKYTFNDDQLRLLLKELEKQEENLQPLSEEETAEIEREFQQDLLAGITETSSLDYEGMRKEWELSNQSITSFFKRARELAITKSELTHRMRMDRMTLVKIEQGLVQSVSQRFIQQIAIVLETPERRVNDYLTAATSSLRQVAASSNSKPLQGRVQTWEEAIQTSSMSEEDKSYWL